MRGLGAALSISLAAHIALAAGAYVGWPGAVHTDQPAPIYAELVYENPADVSFRLETTRIIPLPEDTPGSVQPSADAIATAFVFDKGSAAKAPPGPDRLVETARPETPPAEPQNTVVSVRPALAATSRHFKARPSLKPPVPPRPSVVPKASNDHIVEMETARRMLPQEARRPDQTTSSGVTGDRQEEVARPQKVAVLPDRAGAPPPGNQTSEPQYAAPALGNEPPKYPLAARRRGMAGRVVIEAVVDRSGRIATAAVAVSSGHRLLDRTALRAVRNWAFQPATRGGRAVGATISIPITFKLETTTFVAQE